MGALSFTRPNQFRQQQATGARSGAAGPAERTPRTPSGVPVQLRRVTGRPSTVRSAFEYRSVPEPPLANCGRRGAARGRGPYLGRHLSDQAVRDVEWALHCALHASSQRPGPNFCCALGAPLGRRLTSRPPASLTSAAAEPTARTSPLTPLRILLNCPFHLFSPHFSTSKCHTIF